MSQGNYTNVFLLHNQKLSAKASANVFIYITTRNISEGNYKCLYPSQPASTNSFSYHNQKHKRRQLRMLLPITTSFNQRLQLHVSNQKGMQGTDEYPPPSQSENISEGNYEFLQSSQSVGLHFSDDNYELRHQLE